MPPLAPVRCVVFDLGGVLVRLAGSWGRACEVVGLPVRGGSDGAEARAARHALVVAHEEGRMSHDDFLAAVARSTQDAYTVDEVGRIHRAWVLDPYPGVDALIEHLRLAGVATGILSNTNEVHWREHVTSEERRIRARVDHPHASHLLGARKPARRIYELFAAASGIPAHEHLFFDDLEENVAGARAVGWQAHRIDPSGDPVAQMRAHLASLGALGASSE